MKEYLHTGHVFSFKGSGVRHAIEMCPVSFEGTIFADDPRLDDGDQTLQKRPCKHCLHRLIKELEFSMTDVKLAEARVKSQFRTVSLFTVSEEHYFEEKEEEG